MRRELDEALVRDFPRLYRDRHGDVRQSAMPFGFECGNGWEPLIRRLSARLGPDVVATQVKEKWGGLRFYVDGATDADHAAIDAAERESYVTCEECGEAGRERNDGWIKTLCDPCASGGSLPPDRS